MFDFVKERDYQNKDSGVIIENIEKKYNIRFPQILKKYYNNYDGAKIKTIVFEIDGVECEVAKIVPIGDEPMSFERITDNDKADGFLPDSFYPLCRDRGGNYYYWDSKTYEVYLVLSDDYDNPFKVALSMEEFFDILDSKS